MNLEFNNHIISVKNRRSILINPEKETKIVKIGKLWTAILDRFFVLNWAPGLTD